MKHQSPDSRGLWSPLALSHILNGMAPQMNSHSGALAKPNEPQAKRVSRDQLADRDKQRAGGTHLPVYLHSAICC